MINRNLYSLLITSPYITWIEGETSLKEKKNGPVDAEKYLGYITLVFSLFLLLPGIVGKNKARPSSDKTVVGGCMTQKAQLGRDRRKNGIKGKMG